MLGTQHSTNRSHAKLVASLYSKNNTDKVTDAYDAYYLPFFVFYSGYKTLTALKVAGTMGIGGHLYGSNWQPNSMGTVHVRPPFSLLPLPCGEN